jgi:DNA-binding transcriptional LysR family regulator
MATLLDLRDVEVFLAVERQGSFGRAAAELLITQPAVSERVRHLERLVGQPLFERSNRGVVLTPGGEALLPYARRCVALAAETVEVTRAASGAPAFVVAVHSTFASRVVPFVLGTLATLPRRISIRDVHSEEVPSLVRDGVAHVGFALAASAMPGVRRTPLEPDRVICVAAPDHGIAQLARPTVRALRGAVLAVNPWGDGADEFLTRIHDAGVDDWRIRRCGDDATALTLAHEHGHVAFVSHAAARAHLADGRLRRIPMANLSRWIVRLDLLTRTRDADDGVVAVRTAVATA